MLQLRQFSKAKDECLKAMKINPNLKELKNLMNSIERVIETFYWKDSPFYKFDLPKSIITKKIELLTDDLTDEQIEKFKLTDEDFDILVKLVRNSHFYKKDKTVLILKLINAYPFQNREDLNQFIKKISPLLLLDYTNYRKIYDQLKLIIIKLKEKSFPIIEIIRTKESHPQASIYHANLLEKYPNDEKVKEYTKKVIDSIIPKFNKYNSKGKEIYRDLITRYFEKNTDVEYAKKLEPHFLKGELPSDIWFSYIKICIDQKMEYDLEKYPFKNQVICSSCKRPYIICFQELGKFVIETEKEKLIVLEKDFEKEKYQQVFLASTTYSDNFEFFKLMVKCLVKMNRTEEAYYFVKTKFTKVPSTKEYTLKKDLYLELPNTLQKNQKKDFEPYPFDLNFKIISEHSTENCSLEFIDPFYYYHKKDTTIVTPIKGDQTGESLGLKTVNEIQSLDNEIIFIDEDLYYYNLSTKEKKKVLSSECSFVPGVILLTDKYIMVSSDVYPTKYCHSKFKLFEKETLKEIIQFPLFNNIHLDSKVNFYNNKIYYSSDTFIFEVDIFTGYLTNSYYFHDEITRGSDNINTMNIDENYIVQFQTPNDKLTKLIVWDKNKILPLHEKPIEKIRDVHLSCGYIFLGLENSIEILKPQTLEKVYEISTKNAKRFNSKTLLTEFRLSFTTFDPSTKNFQGKLLILPIENDKRVRKCENCKKDLKVKPKICGGCFQFTYCSKECQLNHWKTHKSICSILKQTKSVPISTNKN